MPRADSPASSTASHPRKRKDRSPDRDGSHKRDRRERSRDRSGSTRDRDYGRRDRDDDRRSSRYESDPRGSRDDHYGRDDRHGRDRGDRRNDRRDDRREDRRERSRERDRDRDRHGERDSKGEDRSRRDEPPRSRVAELKTDTTRTSNGSRTPEPASSHPADSSARPPTSNAQSSAASSTTGAKETPEEEKQRLKREKLEAWKRERAAKAAGGKPASPAPASPQPGTPSSAPAPRSPAAPSAATQQRSSPASRPLGAAGSLQRAAAQAAASTTGKIGFGALGRKALNGIKGLPAKPTFAGADGSSLGLDDDDDKGNIQKLEFAPMSEADKQLAEQPEEEEDEEMQDEEERVAAARAQAQARSEAINFGEEEEKKPKIEEGDTMDLDEPRMPPPDAKAPSTIKAEVVGMAAAKGKQKALEAMEEDEDVDPLEAFMTGVVAEVKKVNAEDRAKLKIGKRQPESDDEEGSEGEQHVAADDLDELDNTKLRAEDILALAAKKLKKKDVQPVDHSKIEYEPFTKAFYHAPPEVEEMTDDEVKVLRLEMDDIKIRGVDCPKPISKWSHCGLPAVCLEVIKQLDYAKPSAIQSQAIPAVMSGRDVIGVAKTGSGKTIAFLLPMFRHIKDQRPLETMEGPIAMIMTPTRELATQIQRDCKPFLKAMGLRATTAYGGTPLKDNIADMKRGAEIIVCTPGRMIELLSTNSGRLINLRRVTYLVLDEADRMFDMGFEPQVMKIISQIRPDRQTVLFSATFPKQMEALARKILKKPLEITVGGKSVVAAEIEQIVEVRPEDTKFNRLLELLGRLYNEDPGARTLIFVDRQEAADNLLRDLLKMNYTCMSLHGGKDQVDRDITITDFKSGIIPIVIATSVAARGLDVKLLKLVINYDCPNHLEDYVHRAGRTGRAGNKGTCITFITPEQDRFAVDIVRALTMSEATVPEELKAMSDAFITKVKEGKAKTVGSGFGGKGLDRLELERDAADRAQRSAYGEPEEKAQEAKAGGEEGAGGAAAVEVPDIEVEIVRGPAPDPAKKGRLPDRPAPGASVPLTPAEAIAKLGPNATPQQKAFAVQAALNASLDATRRAKAQQAADLANAMSAADQARRRDPDATDFHAIVPINDYPQKARWRVTNKETMSHVRGRATVSRGPQLTALV